MHRIVWLVWGHVPYLLKDGSGVSQLVCLLADVWNMKESRCWPKSAGVINTVCKNLTIGWEYQVHKPWLIIGCALWAFLCEDSFCGVGCSDHLQEVGLGRVSLLNGGVGEDNGVRSLSTVRCPREGMVFLCFYPPLSLGTWCTSVQTHFYLSGPPFPGFPPHVLLPFYPSSCQYCHSLLLYPSPPPSAANRWLLPSTKPMLD